MQQITGKEIEEMTKNVNEIAKNVYSHTHGTGVESISPHIVAQIVTTTFVVIGALSLKRETKSNFSEEIKELKIDLQQYGPKNIKDIYEGLTMMKIGRDIEKHGKEFIHFLADRAILHIQNEIKSKDKVDRYNMLPTVETDLRIAKRKDPSEIPKVIFRSLLSTRIQTLDQFIDQILTIQV